MAIFDIEKDELLRLSDTQLEELIARLAEAEVSMHGHSPACVNWSGSITAPDGGIDLHVQVPVDQLKAGFIVRPDTVFQAKKHKMPKIFYAELLWNKFVEDDEKLIIPLSGEWTEDESGKRKTS